MSPVNGGEIKAFPNYCFSSCSFYWRSEWTLKDSFLRNFYLKNGPSEISSDGFGRFQKDWILREPSKIKKNVKLKTCPFERKIAPLLSYKSQNFWTKFFGPGVKSCFPNNSFVSRDRLGTENWTYRSVEFKRGNNMSRSVSLIEVLHSKNDTTWQVI